MADERGRSAARAPNRVESSGWRGEVASVGTCQSPASRAILNPAWGCSSAGRAPHPQCGGRGFESHHLHPSLLSLFRSVSAIHTHRAVGRAHFLLSLIRRVTFAKGSTMPRVYNNCGVTRSEDEFYAVTQRGITRLRAICKECSKAQLRDRSNDLKPDGRICTQCGVYKPLSAFHKHKICRYGVEPMCKACRLEKRRQYTRDYPERVRDTDLRMR